MGVKGGLHTTEAKWFMIESQRHSYHLVDPSPWPISGSLGALATKRRGPLFILSTKIVYSGWSVFIRELIPIDIDLKGDSPEPGKMDLAVESSDSARAQCVVHGSRFLFVFSGRGNYNLLCTQTSLSDGILIFLAQQKNVFKNIVLKL
ncbi:hypothetical protein HRI_004611900 [Hibiscus trionum]|uniref:Cytochrome c oxidase subunit 3 n=1 Tax=Hibiscus trionum TaxID=183268 RepID=A0A9W7J762_HIBTR|nr:hypothetical protein HRI_004611900 [Hibiscus trionum]